MEEVELRRIDLGKEVLQIFTRTVEPKTSERREDNASRRRRTSARPIRAKMERNGIQV
jgi:hypothetical protein